jgi:hypothetical protein
MSLGPRKKGGVGDSREQEMEAVWPAVEVGRHGSECPPGRVGWAAGR